MQHTTQTSPTSLSARYSRDLHALRQNVSKASPIEGCITLSDSEEEDSKTAVLPVRKPEVQPISLDDDDDDAGDKAYHNPTKLTPLPVDDDLQVSDEEFPELVQKARERERQKEEQRLRAAKDFREQNHARDTAPMKDDIFGADNPLTSASLLNSDPIIEILITSHMDGTKPLIVKRRLTQNLREARLGWCDRQTIDGAPMSLETKESIFLTWKNRRLYDWTTCRALGLKVSGTGGLKTSDPDVNNEGRVHLEAWTEDAFETYQKRCAAKQKNEQGQPGGDESSDQEVTAKKIRLIMKTREFEPFKIMAKPNTTVERLITAFCQGRNVPDGKEVTLHVDGDMLEPTSTVGDADLEDMNVVEVHIR